MKKTLRLFLICGLLCLLCACSVFPEQVIETPAPTEAITPVPTTAPPEEVLVEVPTLPVPEVLEVPTAEPESQSHVTPEPLPPLAGRVIGIDPGHQKKADHDPEPIAPDSDKTKSKCSSGTRGVVSNIYEYEVNLIVAQKLKPLLETQGAKVVMTRTENDVNISNRQRAEFMNEHEVDLAIRLHCNGTDDPTVRGAFMLVPNKECTSFFSENVQAASTIIEHYCAVTGLSMRKNKGISYSSEQTGFNWCNRPIICIEMGHLSNETEDLLLTNDAFQDKMAVGIFEGILAYFHPEASEEGGNG